MVKELSDRTEELTQNEVHKEKQNKNKVRREEVRCKVQHKFDIPEMMEK